MSITQKVIDGLNAAGLSAERAYPGSQIPHLTQVRMAVSLEKMEYAAWSATVLVNVMASAAMGGSVCEEAALQAAQAMEALGGECTQEECQFHGYADAYCVRVLGKFYGETVMDGWTKTPSFTVKLGTSTLSNAVSFQAERQVDEATGLPLDQSAWFFRLEEQFGRGEAPAPPPSEPFSLTVSRSTGVETYRECTWISVQVEDTASGLRQVRKGVANSRGYILVG